MKMLEIWWFFKAIHNGADFWDGPILGIPIFGPARSGRASQDPLAGKLGVNRGVENVADPHVRAPQGFSTFQLEHFFFEKEI